MRLFHRAELACRHLLRPDVLHDPPFCACKHPLFVDPVQHQRVTFARHAVGGEVDLSVDQGTRSEVIASDHPIYSSYYRLAGLPKIHEHDGKAPRGYGIFWQGRLVCFYTYECDLGDGWEREGEDPWYFKEFSEKYAYPLGINIVVYAMTH